MSRDSVPNAYNRNGLRLIVRDILLGIKIGRVNGVAALARALGLHENLESRNITEAQAREMYLFLLLKDLVPSPVRAAVDMLRQTAPVRSSERFRITVDGDKLEKSINAYTARGLHGKPVSSVIVPGAPVPIEIPAISAVPHPAIPAPLDFEVDNDVMSSIDRESAAEAAVTMKKLRSSEEGLKRTFSEMVICAAQLETWPAPPVVAVKDSTKDQVNNATLLLKHCVEEHTRFLSGAIRLPVPDAAAYCRNLIDGRAVATKLPDCTVTVDELDFMAAPPGLGLRGTDIATDGPLGWLDTLDGMLYTPSGSVSPMKASSGSCSHRRKLKSHARTGRHRKHAAARPSSAALADKARSLCSFDSSDLQLGLTDVL